MQTSGETGRQTAMTKLIDTSCNYANIPKIYTDGQTERERHIDTHKRERDT